MQPPQPKHRHRRKKGACALHFLTDFFTLGLFHRCSSTRQEEKKTRRRTYHPSWNSLLPSLHNTMWNFLTWRFIEEVNTRQPFSFSFSNWIRHLTLINDRSRGKQLSLFRKHWNSRETKSAVSQLARLYVSGLLYSWKFWSWKYTKPRCNGGRQSTFAHNSALTWRNVIDFTMLPAQRFWRETVLLLDVMWPRTNQRERALLRKKFPAV